MKNFFTILGGMGTLATESFVRVLNQRTPAQVDQDYLNYLLVNHATVPDRTAYILDKNLASPVTAILEDIQQQELLQPNFLVLTCNTAHTFFEELQAATTIKILHMPRLAAKKALTTKPRGEQLKVAILATSGTVNSGVYGQEFNESDCQVVYPEADVQEKVINLIYRDVKESQYLNQELFQEILTDMLVTANCDVAVLGCTELSLMNEVTDHNFTVVDAQSELVDETIRLALAARK